MPASTTTGTTGAVATNVAQPSQEDPFQEVLKAMRGRPLSSSSISNKQTIAVANANAAMVSSNSSSSNATPIPGEQIRSGKKLKRVTWAPDTELEKVKLIERAIYDDDPNNVSINIILFSIVINFIWTSKGSHSAHSIRDLERAEGAAMHIHIFEESIDWYEPQRKWLKVTDDRQLPSHKPWFSY